MRRTPVLLMLVLTTLPVFWGVGPAAAGGPTSVLVSSPEEARVAALHHTDAAYAALDELSGVLDAEADVSTGKRPPAGSGDVVTLTWLIHDVQVWRVDRVHLGGTGAPWVETRLAPEGGSIWDARASWHRANPKLPQLVDEVLRDPGAAALAEPLGADVAAASAPQPGPTRTPVAAVEPRSALTPVQWTGLGVVAGAVVALGALRLSARRSPRPSRR